jgi:hypothetical protein
VTEAELQAAIVELAQLLGWRVYHTHDSRHSAAGFPDLVLVRGRRLVFAELKTGRRRVTEEQARWLAALGEAGVETHVWREDDWLNGDVERALHIRAT